MVQHLAGTEHSAHQEQGLWVLLLRIFKSFYRADKQVPLSFEDLQDRFFVFFGNNTAAQLDIYMHNRSGQNILMAVLQLIAKLTQEIVKGTFVV